MRSRGIGVQQIFGKLAGFFSTNVNSIALDAIKWRYLAIYCGWIFFEFIIVYLLYPETSGRTLEELAFSTFLPKRLVSSPAKANPSSQCSRTRVSRRRPLLQSRSRSTLEVQRRKSIRGKCRPARLSKPLLWNTKLLRICIVSKIWTIG